MRLIVGLGNPEKKYELTRHNLGFLVLSHFVKHQNWKWKKSSWCQGFMAVGRIASEQICCLLPLTYMNHSGVAVKSVVERKEIFLDDVLIVCDDVNIPFGQLRLRPQGSDGGHNGLKSIIYHLESKDFARLRMGIYPDTPQDLKLDSERQINLSDFVLENFTTKEKKILKADLIERASSCCLDWVSVNIDNVMNQYNKQ